MCVCPQTDDHAIIIVIIAIVIMHILFHALQAPNFAYIIIIYYQLYKGCVCVSPSPIMSLNIVQ